MGANAMSLGQRDWAGYLGLGRRGRRPLWPLGSDWPRPPDEQSELPPETAQNEPTPPEPEIAQGPPTPGPAATPEQRSWALEALRREMEGPQPALPVRRGDWGGFEQGGQVYKPSLGSKIVGGVGQFLAAAGGGMGAGARAHEEYFGGPYREALGRAGVGQAMREKRIADLTKVAEEERRTMTEEREARLSTAKIGDYASQKQHREALAKKQPQKTYQRVPGFAPDVTGNLVAVVGFQDTSTREITDAAGKPIPGFVTKEEKPEPAVEDKRRAVRIRQDMGLGKPVSAEDRAWLKGHEAEATIGTRLTIQQAAEKRDETEQALDIAAQSLASGDLSSIREIAGFRGPQLILLYAKVKKLNPAFNIAELNRKIKNEELFTTGQEGTQLKSFDTFLQHAGELHDVIEHLRLTGSPLINKPWNWLRDRAAGNPDIRALVVAAEAPKKEFESFLLNNRALYEMDRKSSDIMLANDSSPAAWASAIKQMGKTAKDRVTAANWRYKRVSKKDLEDPISPEGMAAAEKIGVPFRIGSGPAAGGGAQQPAGGQPGVTAPPGTVRFTSPTGGSWNIPNEKIAEFRKAHPEAVMGK